MTKSPEPRGSGDLCLRQFDQKGSAFAWKAVTLHFDPALVCMDQLFCDCQPKPYVGSPGARSVPAQGKQPGLVQCVVDVLGRRLIDTVENALQIALNDMELHAELMGDVGALAGYSQKSCESKRRMLNAPF